MLQELLCEICGVKLGVIEVDEGSPPSVQKNSGVVCPSHKTTPEDPFKEIFSVLRDDG